jgi:hypothetical protein
MFALECRRDVDIPYSLSNSTASNKLLAIGTNLGGAFIGIDFNHLNRIIACPFGDLDIESFITIGQNFTYFFNRFELIKEWKLQN